MDLSAYSMRIGLELAGRKPDVALLDQVIYAHQCSIPFEDIDIYDLHRGISLEPKDLFDKMVVRKRGGYCFELNKLFCLLLCELGFDAWGCGFTVPDPADGDIVNHRGTIVRIDGAAYFADVGLGGPMPPFAVPLDGARKTAHGETYWVETTEDGRLALMRLRGSGILDGIESAVGEQEQAESLVGLFDCEELPDWEFQAASDLMSIGEDASFRKERLVNLRTPEGYRAIVNDLFIEYCNGKRETMPVEGNLERILSEKFGIPVSL